MATHTFPACTDHSWGRPPPQDIKNAGYTGVGRYLGYDFGPGGRDISKEEMDSYLAVGLQVFFIVEGGANSVRQGWAKGVEHANMANDRLHALGIPTTTRIVSPAVDYDAPAVDLRGPVAEYAKGFGSVSNYPHIPYGNDRALDVLCGELHLFDCGWQTRAWSGGRVSKFACMMQEVGYVLNNTSDHNSIYVMSDVEKLLHPIPVAPAEEDDMAAKKVYFTNTKDSKWVVDVFGAEPGTQHVFRYNDVTFEVRHVHPTEFDLIRYLGGNDPSVVWVGGVQNVPGELPDAFLNGMTLVPHDKY